MADLQTHTDTVHIVSDDRERKSCVIESLLDIENVDVDVQRLPLGDYQIDSRVIVERKTLYDFAVSIIDGRLFKQMLCLANASSKGVLVLEGTAGDITDIYREIPVHRTTDRARNLKKGIRKFLR